MSRSIRVIARTSDPETSHQAALEFEKTGNASKSVEAVVRMLASRGALTDFQIREHWPQFWHGPFSFTLPSKARHWARQQGLVKHIGYAEHQGRRVRTWGLGYGPPEQTRVQQLVQLVREAIPMIQDPGWLERAARLVGEVEE